MSLFYNLYIILLIDLFKMRYFFSVRNEVGNMLYKPKAV